MKPEKWKLEPYPIHVKQGSFVMDIDLSAVFIFMGAAGQRRLYRELCKYLSDEDLQRIIDYIASSIRGSRRLAAQSKHLSETLLTRFVSAVPKKRRDRLDTPDLSDL